jgi:hypothetical protein
MSTELRFSIWGSEPYNLDYCELDEAIEAEARKIADDAGSELLDDPGWRARQKLEEQVKLEAGFALREVGDQYLDPTGVTWTLAYRED